MRKLLWILSGLVCFGCGAPAMEYTTAPEQTPIPYPTFTPFPALAVYQVRQVAEELERENRALEIQQRVLNESFAELDCEIRCQGDHK